MTAHTHNGDERDGGHADPRQTAAASDAPPHGLRHSFARALVRAGVDIVTVAQLLGHSSVAKDETHERQA